MPAVLFFEVYVALLLFVSREAAVVGSNAHPHTGSDFLWRQEYMTENQRIWAQSRNELVQAVTTLGYPAELAELMARELKSPRAIDRMTSYVRQVRPQSEEMLVDEMLAICADINAWREKKESQEAQAKYNARLFYSRSEDGQDDEI